MRIYIDLFFILNLIIDFVVLLGVNILLKRNSKLYRLILASLIGSISSIILFTDINKLLLELISILVMVLISYGFKGIKYTLSNIIYVYLLSTLLGGILYLFNIKVESSIFLTYLIIIIIAIEVVILYIKENKKMKNIYNNYYKVDIYFTNQKKISVVGFLDTGNNLYDPYKKRPIIIMPSKYLNEDNYLLVPYHTISGSGLLKCIKPDIVFIETIGYKGNLLIGFSDSFKSDLNVDVILHKDLMKG